MGGEDCSEWPRWYGKHILQFKQTQRLHLTFLTLWTVMLMSVLSDGACAYVALCGVWTRGRYGNRILAGSRGSLVIPSGKGVNFGIGLDRIDSPQKRTVQV